MIHAVMFDVAREQLARLWSSLPDSPAEPEVFYRPVPERIPDSRLDFTAEEQDREECVLFDLADKTAECGPWEAASRMFNPSKITEGNPA